MGSTDYGFSLERTAEASEPLENVCLALSYVYKYGGMLRWDVSISRVWACSHPCDNTLKGSHACKWKTPDAGQPEWNLCYNGANLGGIFWILRTHLPIWHEIGWVCTLAHGKMCPWFFATIIFGSATRQFFTELWPFKQTMHKWVFSRVVIFMRVPNRE
jgi:hypothetical protein